MIQRKKMNKKGVVSIIVFVVLAMIGLYLLLQLPIPAFAKVKNLINYLFIVIIWIAMQIGIVYGYYKLSVLGVQGWSIYKRKIQMGTIKIKSFLIGRS